MHYSAGFSFVRQLSHPQPGFHTFCVRRLLAETAEVRFSLPHTCYLAPAKIWPLSKSICETISRFPQTPSCISLLRSSPLPFYFTQPYLILVNWHLVTPVFTAAILHVASPAGSPPEARSNSHER
jgi:hypothetical protein